MSNESTALRAYPVRVLAAPGVYADLVIEFDAAGRQVVPAHPRYAVDGVLVDIDVTIPPDLAAAGWFWFGATLTQTNGRGVYVGVGSGPPVCYEQARLIEQAAVDRVARQARRVPVRPTTKATRAKPARQVGAIEQAEMFREAA